MSIKLDADSNDFPVLICDVCGLRLCDPFGDLASTTRTAGTPSEIVLHHAACVTDKADHMPVMEFFKLLMIRNRFGDVGSDGVNDRLISEFPTGGGFGE